MDDRREVHDGVASFGCCGYRGLIGDVAGGELALDALQRGGAPRPADECPHPLPSAGELPDDMTPDEAVGTGDEDHGPHLRFAELRTKRTSFMVLHVF